MKTFEHREFPPDQVRAWLRSPDGERWSARRIRDGLNYHWDDSGVFADVLPDGAESGPLARWPEPLPYWDIDWDGAW